MKRSKKETSRNQKGSTQRGDSNTTEEKRIGELLVDISCNPRTGSPEGEVGGGPEPKGRE